MPLYTPQKKKKNKKKKKLQDDKDVVLAAVAQNGFALHFSSKKTRMSCLLQ